MNFHDEIELAWAADGQKNLSAMTALVASRHAYGLYNFAPNINLLPSVLWHGLTRMAVDGNGNHELMDTIATNNPGG